MTIELTRVDDETYVEPPHTPTPWSEFAESGEWWIQACDSAGHPVGETAVCSADDMSTPDMLFIVRAVNAHDELVGVCTGILECLDAGDQWTARTRKTAADSIRAALAKVTP